MTQDILKEYVSYNNKTGEMRWIKKTSNLSNIKVGELVGKGSDNRPYKRVKLFGKEYTVHRLAWLYEYGYIPKQLDHIDRNPHNNRIDNLREVSSRDNLTNRGVMKSNKTTGIRGVCVESVNDKKFRAYISDNGKQIRLGTFATLEEATNARLEAEKEYKYLDMEVA